MIIDNVWFSTEKKAESTMKLIVYEDKGKIKTTDKSISFTGNKESLRIDRKNIAKIELGNQKPAWVPIIIGALINLIIFLPINLVMYAVAEFAGLPIIFYMTLLVTVLVLSFVVIMPVAIMKKTKWVKISYREEGKEKKAYFSDGSRLGWGGILGGTEELYQKLR